LHRKSQRANEVFINVDLGAVSETLFESELFGSMKGAFTDAKEDRAGRFEIASGGTLFLDEIGNLSLPLQSKLLTALQSRMITRLGSNKPKNHRYPIDLRYQHAALRNGRQGRFRQDLLYRINTVEISLPPLRERREDIKLLVDHFLKKVCRQIPETELRNCRQNPAEINRIQLAGQHPGTGARRRTGRNSLRPKRLATRRFLFRRFGAG
jgi:transcriptional regulator with PAS, ATPase and Fis domain